MTPVMKFELSASIWKKAKVFGKVSIEVTVIVFFSILKAACWKEL